MNEGRRGDHSFRRELYRHYLLDVCADISQSSIWRARLFASAFREKFRIDSETVGTDRRLATLRRALREHDLAFDVSKVPHSDVPPPRWAGYEDLVMFRFESVEYPELHCFSANNPSVIG